MVWRIAVVDDFWIFGFVADVVVDEFMDWRIVVVVEDKEHEGEDQEQKNLVLVVHRYIQWSCNLMADIISKILDIKKLTEWTKVTNGGVHEWPKRKILELRDQIENNK